MGGVGRRRELVPSILRDVDHRIKRPGDLRRPLPGERGLEPGQKRRPWTASHEDAVAEAEARLIGGVEPLQLEGEVRHSPVIALLRVRERRHAGRRGAEAGGGGGGAGRRGARGARGGGAPASRARKRGAPSKSGAICAAKASGCSASNSSMAGRITSRDTSRGRMAPG